MSDELNVAASDAVDANISAPVEQVVTSQEKSTPPSSAREAIERAMRAVDKQPRDDESGKWIKTGEQLNKPATETAPVAKEAPQGQIVPDEPASPQQDAPTPAPTRFSREAQVEWAKTSPVVRAETERAFRELEGGLQQYQQRFEPLKPYDDMARNSGTTLHEALNRYVGLESTLRTDPLSAFRSICENAGLDVQKVGEALAGMPATQGGAPPEMTPLLSEIAELKRQLGTVSQTFEQQRTEQELNRWASDKPRFSELRQVMGQLMQAGMAGDLDQAYEMAGRLQPPPPIVTPPAAKAAIAPTVAPQTRKPSLQITGYGSAPSYGSKVPSSAREAIQNAFARVGGI
jgi:hypothetical protein